MASTPASSANQALTALAGAQVRLGLLPGRTRDQCQVRGVFTAPMRRRVPTERFVEVPGLRQ
jgi:hypothetical protein